MNFYNAEGNFYAIYCSFESIQIFTAPHTNRLFDKIANLESIKPYFLVGGTALCLQLSTRLSEDLDYSNHILSTKNLLAMLTDSSRFQIDRDFYLLNPKYQVTPIEIESYLKVLIKNQF